MSSTASTATRWFQAELDKGHRQNELQEVERSDTEATGYGATNQGSPMRHRLRSSGAMEGQATDGIFPNEAISKKLGEIMGPNHPHDSK